jgi:hypothetical protein
MQFGAGDDVAWRNVVLLRDRLDGKPIGPAYPARQCQRDLIVRDAGRAPLACSKLACFGCDLLGMGGLLASHML